jgi:hypothetical protein
VAAASGLGRPSLDGDRLAYHVAGTGSSRIAMVDLVSGERRRLRRAVGAVLLNPSLSGDRLLYVDSSATRQRLRLGGVLATGAGDRTLFSTTPTARRDAGREPGKALHHAGYPGGRRPRTPARPRAGLTVTLWTTALDATTAYVTSLRHRTAGRTDATLLKILL